MRRAGLRRAPLLVLLALALWILMVLALPSHASGRCFGVPEEGAGPSLEGAWTLAIEVTSSNGLRDSATLGFDPAATRGYDLEYDAVEPLFLFVPFTTEVRLTLYAYFYYPENPETALGNTTDPEATVGLSTSVIQPDANMTWPLQVAYLLPEDARLTLSWDPNRTRELDGYRVELFTPFGEVLAMDERSRYSFDASPGGYDFTIRALSQAEEPGSELGLIVAAIAAYALVVAIIAALRYRKKRRA